jgi:succinate dehydrogenase/fumarate reductase flavoprotein subunit
VRVNVELANLILLGSLLLQSALLREESRGAHFRSDFPAHDAAWRGHLVISRQGTRVEPLEARAAGQLLQASHD